MLTGSAKIRSFDLTEKNLAWCTILVTCHISKVYSEELAIYLKDDLPDSEV